MVRGVSAKDDIVPLISLDDIGAAAADQRIVAGLVEDQVAQEPAAGFDAIVSCPAFLDVVAGAPSERIVTILTVGVFPAGLQK